MILRSLSAMMCPLFSLATPCALWTAIVLNRRRWLERAREGRKGPVSSLIALMWCANFCSCHPFLSVDGDRLSQALVLGTPSVATAAADANSAPPTTSLESATTRLTGGGKEGRGGAGAGVGLDKHPGLGVSLFCTGDEDQHIYGWRGTTVDQLHRHVFRHTFAVALFSVHVGGGGGGMLARNMPLDLFCARAWALQQNKRFTGVYIV